MPEVPCVGSSTTNVFSSNRAATPITVLTTTGVVPSTPIGAFVFGYNASDAVTYVMPLASSCPGTTFTFRSATAFAHALTCSQEVNGTLGFTDGTLAGSKLAVSSDLNSSVILASDGVRFLVLGKSGPLTYAGT